MQGLLYTELSVIRMLMELRSWTLQLYRYRQVLGGMGCVKIFPLVGVRGAQGLLMQIWDLHVIWETTGAIES